METPRRIAVFILAALICAAGVSGCAGGPTLPATAKKGDQQAIPNFQPVTDIPIPANAKLDTERTLILSSRDRWTGRLVIDLDLSAPEAFAFYQGDMPRFNWQPIMSVQAHTSVLTFTREDRAATVQIESRTLGGSTVMITIAPRQPNEPAQIQSGPIGTPGRPGG